MFLSCQMSVLYVELEYYSTCRLIPYPFFGYLLFYIADPDHKIRIRYPRKGVGYEPLGSFDDGSRSFPIRSLAYRTSGLSGLQMGHASGFKGRKVRGSRLLLPTLCPSEVPRPERCKPVESRETLSPKLCTSRTLRM